MQVPPLPGGAVNAIVVREPLHEAETPAVTLRAAVMPRGVETVQRTAKQSARPPMVMLERNGIGTAIASSTPHYLAAVLKRP